MPNHHIHRQKITMYLALMFAGWLFFKCKENEHCFLVYNYLKYKRHILLPFPNCFSKFSFIFLPTYQPSPYISTIEYKQNNRNKLDIWRILLLPEENLLIPHLVCEQEDHPQTVQEILIHLYNSLLRKTPDIWHHQFLRYPSRKSCQQR